MRLFGLEVKKMFCLLVGHVWETPVADLEGLYGTLICRRCETVSNIWQEFSRDI